jgi:hypothetical protein
MAGYAMSVRFFPDEELAEHLSTPIAAHVNVSDRGGPMTLSPDDVTLRGEGVEILRVTPGEARTGLDIDLVVDREALPARLDVRAFGLYKKLVVPVYPRSNVDFDGSGRADLSDYALFSRSYGAVRGEQRYEERFDLMPDGKIDRDDAAAFQMNLVEVERARRLQALESAPEEVGR